MSDKSFNNKVLEQCMAPGKLYTVFTWKMWKTMGKSIGSEVTVVEK